jgi:hypothetical protein
MMKLWQGEADAAGVLVGVRDRVWVALLAID